MALNKLIILTVLLGVALSQTTNFLDKDSKLKGYAEPQWYKDNIPFIEVPDPEIEQVYYYRWSSHKRHVRYTHPGMGYTVTEFVHDVSYSGKMGSLNDAAGHHIYESRWLRNLRYTEDYVNFWSRGGGNSQQYSEWIADAAYAAYLISGNRDFIVSQLPGLVNNFNGWNPRFEPALNLYFISPHNDAMEHSASSEQTDDGFTGGLGYRPSFNSELYANAIAISKIARMINDTKIAEEFEGRAEAIRRGILEHLWDDDREFFFHMFRENNPNYELLDTREEIGFFPWRFGVIDDDPKYERAWKHLFDPEGFNSVYGPTTCEQRSIWFDGNQTSQCCWWNGNSWPYSTGMVLNSLAAQIKQYSSNDLVNANTFWEVFHRYAETQYREEGEDLVPYVGECHSPYRKLWVCDSFNHSEHYAHSTYVDNVLGDLLGIEPQADDTFIINPLLPFNWSYFLVENLLYHGHNITALYDVTGTRYNVGAGMRIYVDGEMVASSPQMGRLSVGIPGPIVDEGYRRKKIENYASNVDAVGYPMVDVSFSNLYVSPWQVVDGRIFYDLFPSNRWDNFGSPNDKDWFSIDFGPGRQKLVDEVKIYVYSDIDVGGDVDCPASIVVEIMNSSGEWEPARNQVSTPTTCVPNDINIIRFNPVKTQKLRLVFTRNTEDNWFVGMTEVEIWAPWPQVSEEGVYEAEDGYIVQANIHASDTASEGSYVGQINAQEAYVEFTGVWVEEARDYQVRVWYANDMDTATMIVIANNVETHTVTFVPTENGWGYFEEETYVTFTVPLQRGNNEIIFKHGDNFVELDKIKVFLQWFK